MMLTCKMERHSVSTHGFTAVLESDNVKFIGLHREAVGCICN